MIGFIVGCAIVAYLFGVLISYGILKPLVSTKNGPIIVYFSFIGPVFLLGFFIGLPLWVLISTMFGIEKVQS